MSLERQRGGLLLAVLASCALGAAVVVGMLSISRSSPDGQAAVPAAATPEYGRQLLRDTAALLGPDQEDPAMRYTGARIACASCHLETGTKPGTLSLVETASRYPRFSGRDGGMGDLRDRINGCMQRSMNGRPLPRDSVEMIAMESYILGLADQYAATAESRRAPQAFYVLNLIKRWLTPPNRANLSPWGLTTPPTRWRSTNFPSPPSRRWLPILSRN